MPKPKGYLLQPEVKRLNDAFHDLSKLCIDKGDRKLALDCLKESKGVAHMVAELRRAEITGPGVSGMPPLASSSLRQIEQMVANRKKSLTPDYKDPLPSLNGGKNGGDATTLGRTQYPRKLDT